LEKKLQEILKEMYAGVQKFVSNASSVIACVTMQTFIRNGYQQQANWVHSGNPAMLGTLLLDWCHTVNSILSKFVDSKQK